MFHVNDRRFLKLRRIVTSPNGGEILYFYVTQHQL